MFFLKLRQIFIGCMLPSLCPSLSGFHCCACFVFRNLSHCSNVTDRALERLPLRMMTLCLDYCWQITDEGLGSIARHCTNLRYLSLFGCAQITDEGMEPSFCAPKLLLFIFLLLFDFFPQAYGVFQ